MSPGVTEIVMRSCIDGPWQHKEHAEAPLASDRHAAGMLIAAAGHDVVLNAGQGCSMDSLNEEKHVLQDGS